MLIEVGAVATLFIASVFYIKFQGSDAKTGVGMNPENIRMSTAQNLGNNPRGYALSNELQQKFDLMNKKEQNITSGQSKKEFPTWKIEQKDRIQKLGVLLTELARLKAIDDSLYEVVPPRDSLEQYIEYRKSIDTLRATVEGSAGSRLARLKTEFADYLGADNVFRDDIRHIRNYLNHLGASRVNPGDIIDNWITKLDTLSMHDISEEKVIKFSGFF